MSSKCVNELCERQALGSEYCCSPCELAANKCYEIHESGPLGHTQVCTDVQDKTNSFYKTIGIDFDGVLHKYEGWCDVENDPIEGAFDAVRELHTHYNLFIFCARDWTGHAGCLDQIPAWFEKHGLGIEVVCEQDHPRFWNDRRILVTNIKLPAVAYIDDRAIRFWDWEQTLADVEALVPRG